jgi:hypothetical protein
MKHKVHFAVAIVVLLSITTPLQAATPKAGAKCTKAGATATASGKKFTCIKSGTKLVWNKGVAIKKPSTAVTPTTPTPTPEPTPTPTPTPTKPTPTPTPTPTVKYPDAPTSFDDLIANYEGISYAAWSKSKAAIAASNDVALPFKALTGANTTLSFKNPAEAFDLLLVCIQVIRAPAT